MIRKLDEILRGSNRENRSDPMEDSRQANDGFGTHPHAEAPPRSRSGFESNDMERTRAALWSAEADVTSGACLPTGPHVRSVPDLTTVHMILQCTPHCLSH